MKLFSIFGGTDQEIMDEEEKNRGGVLNKDLPKLTNEELICLALARLYEAEGVYDTVLTEELYRRARQRIVS